MISTLLQKAKKAWEHPYAAPFREPIYYIADPIIEKTSRDWDTLRTYGAKDLWEEMLDRSSIRTMLSTIALFISAPGIAGMTGLPTLLCAIGLPVAGFATLPIAFNAIGLAAHGVFNILRSPVAFLRGCKEMLNHAEETSPAFRRLRNAVMPRPIRKYWNTKIARKITGLYSPPAATLERLREALENDGDVNACNPAKETLLMLATFRECLDTVRTLVAHGADTKLRNNRNETALHIAECRGLFEISYILKTGITQPTPQSKGYALLDILHKRRPEDDDVLHLIEDGADLSVQDNYGNTPLMVAVKNECVYLPTLQEMVTHTPDLAQKNNYGKTVHNLSKSGPLTVYLQDAEKNKITRAFREQAASGTKRARKIIRRHAKTGAAPS
ncbi:MAG: hypothetical protein OXT65_03910 [Alphaproteobacteria bacterium]|nr:hypothetical protein [Alphaproteobacteria bacterium]